MFLKKHNQGILALIVANIIWGTASPIFKWSLENITPFTLAYWRFAVASLLLFPFCWKHLNFEKKDLPKLILLSLSGIFFNITFFFFGLKFAPSINAPVIASAAPIFIYLFSILILHEKAKFKVLLGTLVSFLGVLIIVIQPLLNRLGDLSLLGNILFLLATIGAVGHVILSKELIRKYKPITIT
ncbi:DMT family transporter, partial [Candidatus Gottesmanbacteria bacterium]|nr:DMT family transporter [Candidatus Gottesmanbacteria bacterium]